MVINSKLRLTNLLPFNNAQCAPAYPPTSEPNNNGGNHVQATVVCSAKNSAPTPFQNQPTKIKV